MTRLMYHFKRGDKVSIIFNSADIAETMNNGVSNVTGADSIITENYTNVVQSGIKIDMSVSEKAISGVPPLTFNSDGTRLIDYTIYGNTLQDGTPTPSSPVAVSGVGTLSSGNYVIPVSTNAVSNINLNSVPTTRKIKKLTLTGNESWSKSGNVYYITSLQADYLRSTSITTISTHYKAVANVEAASSVNNGEIALFSRIGTNQRLYIGDDRFATATEFADYLAEQYSNNTPVTVWYVLANETTTTHNEPLMKIGDYADSVSYSQAGVTIPTASGNNTLDVQTTPKPSNVSITYKGR